MFLLLIFAVCGVLPVLRVSAQCASDEVADASNVCNCNPSTYTSQVAPPTPVIECGGGNMKISILKCQLEKSRFDSSNLHLIDPTCVGNRFADGTAKMVLTSRLSTGACGNKVAINGSHVTYSNTLYISPNGSIKTKPKYNASLSCSFPLNFSVALNTTLHPVIGINSISVPGVNGDFSVFMIAYRNEDFSEELQEDSIVYVEDTIYISVIVPDLDGSSFSVQVLRMYASASPGSTPEYDLLTNGCPGGELAELMSVRNNGNGAEARFAVKVFKITGSNTAILKADVLICQNTCVPACVVGIRSSDNSNPATSTVGISVSAEERAADSSSTFNRFSLPFTLGSLLLSLLIAKVM